MNNDFGSPLLHPLLASRWSPASFDVDYEVPDGEIDALLEAARWGPSAGNAQPWAFIVGRRGDATHERLVVHLAGSSAPWAPGASLLIANLAHRLVEGTEWESSKFSLYDLGQAVAHMTLQAEALGLSTRQFRAFDRGGVATEFAVPGHWEVTTMMAIGRPPLAGAPTPETKASPTTAKTSPIRQRRTANESSGRGPDPPGEVAREDEVDREPGGTLGARYRSSCGRSESSWCW